MEGSAAGAAAPLRGFKPREKALVDLVQARVDAEPYFCEGPDWAITTRAEIAKELGITERQVTRLIHSTPLCRVVKKVDNKKVTLLRVGNPAEKSPEDFARIMAADWKRFTGRNVSPREFGLLVGIAREPHPQVAPDIFWTVLHNWTLFMTGVSLAIEEGKLVGDAYSKDGKGFHKGTSIIQASA